jgi:hypothetical protein
MNKKLETVLGDDDNNVAITTDHGREIGRKVASIFGNVYIWKGVEVSEEEMTEEIISFSGILHWEIY